MKLSLSLAGALLLALPTLGQLSPPLPLKSSSRWILDANNQRVKFRCVNWAGHMETHLPEGLHKQSIEWVADWIKNQGFNCVRLTYATDHAMNPGLRVLDAFKNAGKATNVAEDRMVDLYNRAVSKNPFMKDATTRDVYNKVVDTLWNRGVMTILDNHVSRASWCCNLSDGNGWPDNGKGYTDANSRFYKTDEWIEGLKRMASWAKGHKGIVGMSLRNEMRAYLLQELFSRGEWYGYVGDAGRAVHAINKDVLIIVGGVGSTTDLSMVRNSPLDLSGWPGKHVWEMHAYSFTATFRDLLNSCSTVQTLYGFFDGFVLEQGKATTGPLFFSEFGVGMTGGPHKGLNDGDNSYLTCLTQYLNNNDADWAVWAIQGTYYIRDGVVDKDEGWGLLNKDWTGWRNPEFPGLLGNMWKINQRP